MLDAHAHEGHGAVEAAADETATPAFAAARRTLLAELCGLGATMSNAMEAMPGFVPCGHAFGVVIQGLYAFYAAEDLQTLQVLTNAVNARAAHISDHRGVPQGAAAEPKTDAPEPALLLAALGGISADAYFAMQAGRMSDDVDVFVARALKALGEGAVDHGLLVRTGEVAVLAQQL